MQNYFSLFGLPTHFDLDPADLEKRYFAVQREAHPDRLTGKSAAERQQAIGQSMLFNEAYEILKSPLKRARHLLTLLGMITDSLKPPQELLLEILELREALAEAQSAEDMQSLAHKNEGARKETLAILSQAFSGNDRMKAAALTMRLSYLAKLEEEIKAKRKHAAA